MPLQKQQRCGAADASSSGGISSLKYHHPAKEVTGSISGGVSQKQQRAKEKMSEGSIGQIPRKHQTKQEISPSITGSKHPKRNKPSTRNSSQCTSGQQRRTIGSYQCLNAKAGHSLVGKSTVDRKGSAADKNTIVHVKDGEDLQEADNEIQRLNELDLGEDISSDEFLEYFKQLPDPPDVDTYAGQDDKNLAPLYECHARYRIRYLKLSPTEYKAKLNAELKEHDAMDLLEEDLSGKLLAKMGYLKHYEKDGTLDWFFHHDLCRLEALDDYQRLVPRNPDALGYADDDWAKYHKFCYSYEIEQEYIKYCKELEKNLKWMKDYVLIEKTSPRWDMISTRGAYQAIKIATGFSKITGELAYTGYDECVKKLQFDAFWLDGLDRIYFEVWLRVTKQMKSFRDALEEVYKLKMHPMRQERMKYALDIDCSDMEDEDDPNSCQEFFWENAYLSMLNKDYPHLVPPNYQTFSSFGCASPEAAPATARAQPSSVVYPAQQRLVQEPHPGPSWEEWNQVKSGISEMKMMITDLKYMGHETRLELAEHRGQIIDLQEENRKRQKKDPGSCMQGTIFTVVVLFLALVLGLCAKNY